MIVNKIFCVFCFSVFLFSLQMFIWWGFFGHYLSLVHYLCRTWLSCHNSTGQLLMVHRRGIFLMLEFASSLYKWDQKGIVDIYCQMALRVLYIHVLQSFVRGPTKNRRFYFWINLRLLLIIPCGGLLMSGVSYGLERLQSSDGGFCIALVPADIWTSLPSSSLSFLKPSVLINQCCCCCNDVQLSCFLGF